jgi:hypothetical protein
LRPAWQSRRERAPVAEEDRNARPVVALIDGIPAVGDGAGAGTLLGLIVALSCEIPAVHGLHFAGRHGDEATLLALAAELETAQPWFDRVPAL